MSQPIAFERLLEKWARGLADDVDEREVDDRPSSMREFCDRVRPTMRWYMHTRRLAHVLDRMLSGDLRRVFITMPPQYGKSTLAAVIFPAMFLRANPTAWIGLASYGASLALNRGRDARDLYTLSGGVMREGVEAGASWQTFQGGGMWTVGVRGPATGKPASLLICDDPVKNHEEAASPIVQKRNLDWYKSTWLARESRFADRPLMQIHIQTRWDENDLGGAIIALEDDDPWHVVHFPHLYEPIPPGMYPANWTIEPDWRKPGEPLCPEIADRERVDQIRRTRGAYFWEALDQGWPQSSRGGGVFQARWFQHLERRPDAAWFDELVRAWDDGATEGGGDKTAGFLVGKKGDDVYLLDLVMVQEGGKDVKLTKLQTFQRDVDWCRESMNAGSPVVLTPQDPGAAGKADAEATARLLRKHGATVEIVRPTGAKRIRARPLASAAAPIEEGGELVSMGRIWVVDDEWTEGFLSRAHGFTGLVDQEDDDIDAAADAFNFLERDKPPVYKAGVF